MLEIPKRVKDGQHQIFFCLLCSYLLYLLVKKKKKKKKKKNCSVKKKKSNIFIIYTIIFVFGWGNGRCVDSLEMFKYFYHSVLLV